MTTISFNIPDEKVTSLIATMKWLFPIPLDENQDPLFTDGQWAKEALRRQVVTWEHQYRMYLARVAAESGEPEDNDLMS